MLNLHRACLDVLCEPLSSGHLNRPAPHGRGNEDEMGGSRWHYIGNGSASDLWSCLALEKDQMEVGYFDGDLDQ